MISKSAILLPMSALIASCACDPVPDVITHRGSLPAGIESRTYWNNTGIHLKSGQQYQFHVTGAWTDWFVPAGPEGINCPLARAFMSPFRYRLRYSSCRDSNARFFQPIGTIGRGEGKTLPAHAFIIRDGMNYTAPASGILHVFANDDPSEAAYANNCGKLSLTVTRVP